MPPELTPSDEDYASSTDSDFAPDAVPGLQSEESSDDDSEAEGSEVKTKATPVKRKHGGEEEAEDAEFENSGDEAIIEKGLRKRRKKGKRADDDGDDEGGDGGLIKTRSMRAQEKIEKKPLATTTASTIDVDAMWESMISNKPPPASIFTEPNAATNISSNPSLSPESHRKAHPAPPTTIRRSSSTLAESPDSLIMIKRTYNFAGKVHTEQKLVPRSSAEAKLYLSTQDSNPIPPSPSAEDTSAFPTKRRVPKARRSRFEPIIENLLHRTDLNLGVRRDVDGVIVGVGRIQTKEAKKLNTVEMSAMDWATFVDKEGIQDELDAAGKAKGAYKARQEFLERVERKREEEERRARGLV